MVSISAEQARDVYGYDSSTGLFWRKTKKRGPIKVAPDGRGYKQVMMLGQRIYLHRLAWLLHYGEWPKGQVDHIDGDVRNNAISNLRDVDHSANAQNIHVSWSSSGYLGVSYERRRDRYIAQISVGPRANAKGMYLGSYKTAAEAHEAYLVAKAKYHPAAAIASRQW